MTILRLLIISLGRLIVALLPAPLSNLTLTPIILPSTQRQTSNMTESTVDAIIRRKVQLELPGSSLRNSKQNDDDCVSEDSFGSDFDNATDKEILREAGLDGDTEPDSPPVYSEEEHSQSLSLLANMDVKPPPMVMQWTPPRGSTELEPAFNVTPHLSGPSMCVVCGLISNPMLIILISIN